MVFGNRTIEQVKHLGSELRKSLEVNTVRIQFSCRVVTTVPLQIHARRKFEKVDYELGWSHLPINEQ